VQKNWGRYTGASDRPYREDTHKYSRMLRNLSSVIITNRMKKEGGAWQEVNPANTELISLIPIADAVDIELCAERRCCDK